MPGRLPEPDYPFYARQLADALIDALPGWVERSVENTYRHRLGRTASPEVITAAVTAGRRAADEVGPTIRDLLDRDVDDQPTTPLALVRGAVGYPTAVLSDAGVPPATRDEFASRAFPSDVYDLSPASFADVDPDLAEVGIAWGAAKAFTHKRRHQSL